MIRRDILKFGAGAAAGIALTPLPWRILGDIAMWSQNWSWMPRVPRGEIVDKDARCTLCSGACPVKARCVNGVPTGLWPRESALCPAGFVAHHFAFHPIRLRACYHRGKPATTEEALQTVSARLAEQPKSVAVLDLVPGRTASHLHRMHLARIGGTYLTPPLVEGATAQAIQSLLIQSSPLAADLANVKTVLSLSTPLLDGWLAPARAAKSNRAFRLIQAEARRSRTAGLADEWLSIRPGSEAALALAIAHVLLGDAQIRAGVEKLEGFTEWAEAAGAITLAQAAESTGLDAACIEELARTLALEGPALIIADGDPVGGPLGSEIRATAAALNIMLGVQGFKALPVIPAPKEWAGVAETPLAQAADGSIALLLIDEPLPGLGLPWPLIASKLAKDAMVVALTWNQPHYASHSDWMVPVPVFLETPQDTPPAHDTTQATFVHSPALLKPPASTMHAADFVARLSGDEVPFTERLAERIKALGADTEALAAGGEWLGPAATAPSAARRILPADVTADQLVSAARASTEPLQITGYGWRTSSVSPLLGKLWQESDLRDAPRNASAHPDTLRTLNLAESRPARLQALTGGLALNISPDEKLPQGIVAVCGGPGFSQLCEPDSSGAWRVPGAKVVPA